MQSRALKELSTEPWLEESSSCAPILLESNISQIDLEIAQHQQAARKVLVA